MDDTAASGGIAEHVYQALFRMVMESDIAPGSRMVIDKIASDLGVSSTPVREALARLETQGLVTKERLRGYFATEIMGSAEFADLWEFRRLLEPHAARQAAMGIDRTGKVRLQYEVDSIRQVRLQDDYASMTTFREHDHRLHDLIFEFAGNAHLRKAMDQAHVYNRMFRIRFAPIDGYHAIQEHADIARAIIKGDADAADAAMREHLELAYHRIEPYLQ
ncbi:GntR family transcriptional regulator [Microbacterium sp.]|uniref:GntR family transcriptional regulator n=1 Tax=Microbacterium sp. TaxID=51671 RepID=UPI00262F861C|nr:GntR family transcriptional regulator [Microbacterium sp.]